MVLPEVRAELRRALLAFQQGKTTHIDFYFDTYAELCAKSDDRAVAALGDCWSGHCGAVDLETFRLIGSRALSAEDWVVAKRCNRFL